MARIKPEDIIDHLSTEMRAALEAAIQEVIPDAEFDRYEVFRAFKRAVRRKCSTWETVMDSHVEVD